MGACSWGAWAWIPPSWPPPSERTPRHSWSLVLPVAAHDHERVCHQRLGLASRWGHPGQRQLLPVVVPTDTRELERKKVQPVDSYEMPRVHLLVERPAEELQSTAMRVDAGEDRGACQGRSRPGPRTHLKEEPDVFARVFSKHRIFIFQCHNFHAVPTCYQ